MSDLQIAVMAPILKWLKLRFCQHRTHVYEPPHLLFSEDGCPYVKSRSYCKDCGTAVSFPLWHDPDAAHRTLTGYSGEAP